MVQLATWTNNVLKRSGSPLPSSSSSSSDRLPDFHRSGDDSTMKNPLSKLAPQERKWAIGILAVVIVIVFFLLPGSSSSSDALIAAVRLIFIQMFITFSRIEIFVFLVFLFFLWAFLTFFGFVSSSIMCCIAFTFR